MHNTLRLVCVLALPLATVSGCRQAKPTAPPSPEAAGIKAILEARQRPSFVAGDAESTQLYKQVQRFYREHDHNTAWITAAKSTPRLDALVRALNAAWRHGLDPAVYDLTRIGEGGPTRVIFEEKTKFPPERVAELDVALTYTYFRYATHLTAGRLNPQKLDAHWTLRPQRTDLVNVLVNAVREDRIEDALKKLVPVHPEYVALEEALLRYREIDEKGGWPAVQAPGVLKPGLRHAGVPSLRRRLAISGDLAVPQGTPADPSPIFDANLQEAVRRFQERHRIKPTGTVDRDTLAALNVPVTTRLRQIELNLERWRWLPDTMPARYLRVNVPDYYLQAVEGGKAAWSMRVIVGKPENPTPIFADQMTHLIFSPFWNVPDSIAQGEILPKIAADPDYLEKNNMEVVDSGGAGGYRLRQKPGSANALGYVKFMFPNQFNVYLHDTPTDGLFSRVERSFSHGCVRVEDPMALALYVLRDQPEWTRERIDEAMKAGTERTVTLKTSIPVFILYHTVWVDEAKGVHFQEDIYRHDAEQIPLLNVAPAPAPRVARTAS